MILKNTISLTSLCIMVLFSFSLSSFAEQKTKSHSSHHYIKDALNLFEMPDSNVIWTNKRLRIKLKRILKNTPPSLRYRYWINDGRTVWILDMIGKLLPITMGITIENDKILDITILKYRESHGSEIKFPTYRSQFQGAGLNKYQRLNKPINGISGATLSVNSTKKMARIALLLHNEVMIKEADKIQAISKLNLPPS